MMTATASVDSGRLMNCQTDDTTRTLGGRASMTTELGRGEDLRTELNGNKHTPRSAQCEMEHTAGVRAIPMTKPGAQG